MSPHPPPIPPTPSGAVMTFAMNTAPAGWLKADGSLVSRVTYSDLFAAIGTTYGAGDGSTTFKLPDLRGEFVRGWDDGRGKDSGRSFGTNQGHAFQTHTHTQNSHNHSQNAHSHGVDLYGTSGSTTPKVAITYNTEYRGTWTASNATATNIATTATNQNAQASGANSEPTSAETRPVNVALLYCIKI